jgi:hypothetical protein
MGFSCRRMDATESENLLRAPFLHVLCSQLDDSSMIESAIREYTTVVREHQIDIMFMCSLCSSHYCILRREEFDFMCVEVTLQKFLASIQKNKCQSISSVNSRRIIIRGEKTKRS